MPSICETLDVSRSGFHAWLVRAPSARARSDEKFGARVRASFFSSYRTYGVRRIWHDLLAEGLSCGLHRIERLMRVQGLKARPGRRGLPKGDGLRSIIADNVLDRQFTADAPNQRWIADFTYIWTAEGWLYVADVIDLFSRRAVGWDNAAMESFFSSLKTERIRCKTYHTRNHAKAEVFDSIERFYNLTRRHSTFDYLSPINFQRQAQVA